MDEMLKMRLNILLDAGEINEEIVATIEDFIKFFEEKHGITMTEDNSSMFITHIAMALARIQRGEEINAMDEIVLQELKQSPLYDELPEIYKKLEGRLNIKIPESEKGFIALHVCNLLNSKNK